MGTDSMSTGSALKAELGRITSLVQARGVVARAFCKAHGPCFCGPDRPCHAETLYAYAATLVVADLEAAGLLALNGASSKKGNNHDLPNQGASSSDGEPLKARDP